MIGKGLSAFIVQCEGQHILLDCGEGTSYKLLEKGFDGNQLDHVVISHYHPDHISGIFMMLQLLYLQGRTKPLSLFLPEKAENFVQMLYQFYTFPQKFSFELAIFDMTELHKQLPFIQAIATDHLRGYAPWVEKLSLDNPMSSWGFIIYEGTKSLFYSADLHSVSFAAEAIQSTDLAIVDALHPDANALWKLFETAKGTILLNHGLSKKIQALQEQNQLAHVKIIQDNDEFQI